MKTVLFFQSNFDKQTYVALASALMTVLSMNAVIDPFITIFTQKLYRNEVYRWMIAFMLNCFHIKLLKPTHEGDRRESTVLTHIIYV